MYVCIYLYICIYISPPQSSIEPPKLERSLFVHLFIYSFVFFFYIASTFWFVRFLYLYIFLLVYMYAEQLFSFFSSISINIIIKIIDTSKLCEISTLQWPMLFGEACVLQPDTGQRLSWLCIVFLDLLCLFSHALLAGSTCFTYAYRE
jgi:hypothetical protein